MSNEELFAATAVKTWTTVVARLEKTMSSLSDEDLQREIAPGRNRVYYILGHLTAHHDLLLPLLGIGDRFHTELDEVFIANPDRHSQDKYTGSELRKLFADGNARITFGVQSMAATDLLKRHAAVTEQDFAREPLRNRLAILESRTTHVTYHAGQIRLVEIARERAIGAPFENKAQTRNT